jgi:plastocyanin
MREAGVKIAGTRLVMGAVLVVMLGWASLKCAKYRQPVAQAQAEEVIVKIDNFSFKPQEIFLAVGTKVIWVNQDDIPHTVRSTTDTFKSRALDTDDRFSFTFEKAGTYEYYCSIHPKMMAKVIVK